MLLEILVWLYVGIVLMNLLWEGWDAVGRAERPTSESIAAGVTASVFFPLYLVLMCGAVARVLLGRSHE